MMKTYESLLMKVQHSHSKGPQHFGDAINHVMTKYKQQQQWSEASPSLEDKLCLLK